MLTGRALRASLLGLLSPLVFVATASAADLDGDGVPDDADDCVAVSNPGQADADADGFGNRCDGDFNQDGVVNFVDLARMKQSFFKQDALTDLNGDGVVNFGDLALLKAAFFKPPGPKCPTCPIDPCQRGRALLCPGLDVVGADTQLEKCLAVTDPATKPQQFQSATFFRALTRVTRPVFEQKPGTDPARIDSISEALDALGVGATGRSPLDFTAALPLLPNGRCVIPEGVKEADLERAILTELRPRVDDALASLPAVQAGWVDHCDVARFGRNQSVEIDGSDALLLRAHLHALRGALHLLAADDLDFDIGELCAAFRDGPLPTIESFLRDHPGFATRGSSPEAQAARLDGMEALDLLSDALDAIHSEVDPQSDDFAFIDATDPNGLTPDRENELRARIDYARVSFVSAILAPPGVLLPREIASRICGDPSFFAGALFNGPGLRSVLPPFIANAPDVDRVPDPTFGGLFPKQAADGLRCALGLNGPLVGSTPGPGRTAPSTAAASW